ncbi:MAG: hypothetical protein IT462_11255 [Planctomycetes bacterium]|nr:hypothetical protein [Planctomycetota bacterium]
MPGAPRYFGQAETTIDAKNRITLPAKFRGKLPASPDGPILLFVVPGAEFRHLDLFDSESGMERVNALTGATGLPDATQRSRQNLLKTLEQVECDRQGRILLPRKHVEWARLSGAVIVAGAGDHMQLYTAAEAKAADALADIDELDPSNIGKLYDTALKKPQ